MDLKLEELLEYGRKNDSEKLQAFVEELQLDDINRLIPDVLVKSEASEVLEFIFSGLTQSLSSMKKRFKIIEIVILNLKTNELTAKEASVIVSKVSQQLDKLSVLHLIKINNICIEYIRQSNKNSSTIYCTWKEILPKVLCLLVDRKKVNHSGTEMTGLEYKCEVIRSLCMINWSPHIITNLASMFTETPLSSDEHEQVIRKICSTFDDLNAHELPPLIHQLLQLCKEEHAVIVFVSLRNYFNKHIHSKTKDEHADLLEDVIEAESTVLCHIEEFARISRLNDLIKLCKNSVHSPDLLLDPFLLSVLLALSCIAAYEVQVMDLLKIMLSHVVVEEERIKNSAWLRSIIESHISVENIFQRLINSRIGELDKVMKGMINLGFVLLSSSGIKGKEAITKKLWSTGRIVLVTLIKRHRQVTKTVLHTLTDRIIAGVTSHQYTDCMLHLCNVATMSMLDNLPLVIRILEFIHQLPGTVSRRIVTGIIPLIRISTKLRDNLILILRKALFSREIETRQTAVLGFLQLLRFLKLQGFSELSQNSMCVSTFSGPSVFTQICLDVYSQQTMVGSQQRPSGGNMNITICLEVLGILKRCFSQQASVKLSLYKGLYNAVSVNSELCISVMDVLLDHFGQFYNTDDSVLPPLKLDKIAVIQGSEVLLREPIGRLVLLIQDTVVKSYEVINKEDPPRSFTILIDILNSLVKRFSKCDLIHFQLDEDTNLLDIVPDSLLMQETIKQVISVYEALMAYVVNSCNSENCLTHMSRFVSLHKAYSSITTFIKECNKSGKKKDDGGGGQRARKKQKMDDTNVVLPKKSPFKIPPTVVEFRTINRILSIFLLDEINWLSETGHNEVKHRRQIFHYGAEILSDSITQTKIRLNEEKKSSTVFKDASLLTKLLYERCVRRYEEVSTFEPQAAILCLECFSDLCSMINTYYSSQFSSFLQDVVFIAVDDGIASQLMPVLNIYKELLTKSLNFETESVEDIEEEENWTKQLTHVLLTTLTTFVTILPSGDPETIQIFDWLVSIAEKQTFENTNSAKMFMNLLYIVASRCKIDLTVLDSISLQIKNLFPSVNEEENERTRRPLLVLNDSNKTLQLPLLCSVLTNNLDDADWIITRLKSEQHILPYITSTLTNEDDNIKNSAAILQRKEREVCQRLTHITLMTQMLCSIALPATGPCMESVFRLATRNYNVLCALTKYFTIRSTSDNLVYQNALFHKLVKVGGTHLSNQVAELIIFVEAYEIENKKASGKLVNSQAKKQAILIPKLVSELENFPKLITILSKKCKDTKLSNNVKLTTTRDFRLNVKKLEEVINKQQNENESDADNEDGDVNVENGPEEVSQPCKKRKTNS